MAQSDDQQFCLRWNNFQANITSQFETLRDDEDFTDVTIACDGQRLQAHKVVLSACSPFFKDLFKANPCSHPIIFMRDVEAQHIVALMEFMYAGEVNVAQAHLSTFLKTAESLKIRGLTDTSSVTETDVNKEDTIYLNSETNQNLSKQRLQEKPHISSSSTVTSSQDISNSNQIVCSPPPKKHCNFEAEPFHSRNENGFSALGVGRSANVQPKVEIPDYLSDGDEDGREENDVEFSDELYGSREVTDLQGGMDLLSPLTGYNKDMKHESSSQGNDVRKLHSLDPRPCEECGKVYSNLSNLRQHMRLIHYPTYVQCNVCQKPFKTDLYLRRHMLSSHGVVHGFPIKSDMKSVGNAKFYDFPNKNGVRYKYDRGSYCSRK